MIGTVDKWNDERGFGFIEVPGEQHGIFVHRTAIVSGPRNEKGQLRLEPGTRVDFTRVKGREGKGWAAINVMEIV